VTINVTLFIPQKELPMDYRPTILSLFKALLSRIYPEDFERLYASGVSKNFTFAMKFESPVFSEGKLSFSSENVLLRLSSGDEYLSMLFYNAFCKSIGYAHPLGSDRTMSVRDVHMLPQPKMNRNTAVIKFLSPLVVRKHMPGEPDRYYVFADPEFAPCLDSVVSRQIGRSVKVLIEPVAPKKTVVRCFGVKIRCSLGFYRITTEPEILDALTKGGLGSRRDMGFGLFAVTGG